MTNEKLQEAESLQASSISASQGFSSDLCIPTFHNRVHKRPQNVSILSQMNPVHALAFSFFKIRFNIIIASSAGLLSLLFPFSPPNAVCISLSPLRATRPAHPIHLAAPHPPGCPVPAAMKKLTSRNVC